MRGALTTGPRLRRRPERQRTGRAAAAAVPCRRVAGLRRWRDQSKEGIFIPKYLIQASHSNEGFEGVGTKGGSSRRDAVAETCPQRGRGGRALAVDAAGGATTTTTVLLTPEQVDDAAKRSVDAVDYRPPGT